jgi:hypothetical protein
VRLVWPAVNKETTRALGEGDWRPSLNWLDVFELLDDPPKLIPRPVAAAIFGARSTGCRHWRLARSGSDCANPRSSRREWPRDGLPVRLWRHLTRPGSG